MPPLDFSQTFKYLTGAPPFPWQSALFTEFISGQPPSAARIPTGLGKTSIVAIWLIALALYPDRVPRRLVYVVNRRTVVDQTTTEVLRLRSALTENPALTQLRNSLGSLCALPLPTPDAPALAISTLRGQFADNGEWSGDPSRPAVVVGTVDMIGSGLLFSRYTKGFKTRPLHAGFLAQDSLLVHDEAHLEPSFQKLLETLVATQKSAGDPLPLRLIALTATSRTEEISSAPPFTLTAADYTNEIIEKRIRAVKRLSLVTLGEGEKLDAELLIRAKEKTDERAVLVFTRTVDTAIKVAVELDKGVSKGKVATLTGTMRGKERDDLVSKNPIFQRFLPVKQSDPARGRVYLVATSAGEVGINISADDLVCDLSTYESMAQRFGRVNRFGDTPDCTVTVVHEREFDTENKKTGALEAARARTLALLVKLGDSASPAALEALPPDERGAAFSPAPDLRVATGVQFDAWALTSIREPIAARPPVAPYLHGEAEWQPPETHLAWRDDRDFRHIEDPEAFLDDFPLKPAELLRDTTSRVVAALARVLEGKTSLPDAWLVAENGTVSRLSLSNFDSDSALTSLSNATLILPVGVGGLDASGLFTGKNETTVSDVSGIIRHECPDRSELPDDVTRVVRSMDISEEDADHPRFLLWCDSNQEYGMSNATSTAGNRRETLNAHTAAVVANANAIGAKLFTDHFDSAANAPDLRRCIDLAARLHDIGKNRMQWQRNLGNLDYDPGDPETILAKSYSALRPRGVIETYRHEFGSLLDAARDAESAGSLATLSALERDIVLHLIAAHHGRARPHFPEEEVFDYAADSLGESVQLATEIPRRFARLQQFFGRWGLAWLESVLRAADYAASAGIVAQSNPSLTVQTFEPVVVAGQSQASTKIAPTATLAVDLTNPGHFFACCGLLELASALNPGVLGWFAEDGSSFHINSPNLSLKDLISRIADSRIIALDSEDRPLTSIDICLDENDPRLRTFRVDWWRKEGGLIGKLKPWAGQMSVRDIADDMRETLKRELATPASVSVEDMLFLSSTANNGEPFYFDANRAVNAKAQDVGFSVDKLKKGGVKITSTSRPAVELLCLIGLQRARPLLAANKPGKEREYDYHIWHCPLPPSLLAAGVVGSLPDASCRLRFSNPSRAKDYRAFSPSKRVF